MYRLLVSLTFLSYLFFVNHAYAEDKQETIQSLLGIEDFKVTSVSKVPENAFKAASAIFVISEADIKRSGATSIPEALRLVPGLEVARIDSNKWAITSRGFNRQFSNKMLVLIDGRTVYTPLFSGVFWDIQDTIIEDIDRIEVIRGPGATQWGANAVNGVINIITKKSVLTQGGLISTIYGNAELGNVSLRYGGELEDVYYRAYLKGKKNSESNRIGSSIGADDNWGQIRTGFRVDSREDTTATITIQGDAYEIDENLVAALPSNGTFNSKETGNGGNLMMQYNKSVSPDSSISFSTYVDYINRETLIYEQYRSTFDMDIQHNYEGFNKHHIVWGAGYRFFRDDISSKPVEGLGYLVYTPSQSYNSQYSGFFQDKISIIDNKLYLTIGSKLEYNYYTAWEIQPSARIAWSPNEGNTLWASVSRAVRTPSRGERGLTLSSGVITQSGSSNSKSEILTAYELGYRVKPLTNLSFDVSTYFNDYTKLRSFEFISLTDLISDNNLYGESYGVELSSEWRITEDWGLTGSYSFLSINLHTKPGSTDIFSEKDEDMSPQNQFKLVSHYNILENVELDNMLYYVDQTRYTASGVTTIIPSYTRFDTRIAWKPQEELELSLVGQNLLDDRHQEFGPALFSLPTEIGRTFYGKVTWRF